MLRNAKGRFVRNPVTAEQFFGRVHQLTARNHSVAEAEQIAADELKLVLILDGIGEVMDWVSAPKDPAFGWVQP